MKFDVFNFLVKKVAKIVPFMFTDGCETEGSMDNSHPPQGFACNGRFCEYNQE
jgi:hypothetical protein